jgi:hypothetical protein
MGSAVVEEDALQNASRKLYTGISQRKWFCICDRCQQLAIFIARNATSDDKNYFKFFKKGLKGF